MFFRKPGISGEKDDNTRSRKLPENRLVIQQRVITLKQELHAITKAIGNGKTEVVTLGEINLYHDIVEQKNLYKSGVFCIEKKIKQP